MAADRLEVVRAGPARQDAGVDGRVQGLDPPVHHLGKASHVGDANDRETGSRQGRRGATGRDEFDPEGSQAPAKLKRVRSCPKHSKLLAYLSIYLTFTGKSPYHIRWLGGQLS